MRRRVAFVLLLIVVALGAFGQQRGVTNVRSEVNRLPSASKRWALIVGINKYRDAQLTGLVAAERDAEMLAAALNRYASFPEDQIIILSTNQSDSRQPTRGNILRYLSNLGGLVPEDGLFLVAFSGHGIERKGRAFLLPSDAQVSDDIHLLEETAISVARMQDWIEETHAAQVIVLLDACRNDPMPGRSSSPNPLSTAYTSALEFEIRNQGVQAFATIYATKVGARAYEYTDKMQGYFTWALVQGLQGKAANEEGAVTLGGLIRYVQNVVPKQVAIDLGRGYTQYPFSVIKGYRADELVLSMTRVRGDVQQVVPPQPQPPPRREADPPVTRTVESVREGVMDTPDGKIQPRPGWEWIKPDDPKDTSVRLKVGYKRGTEPDSVAPADGWEWVDPNDKKNYDVRLKEGLRQADDDPGTLLPSNGWEWVHPGDKKNFEVRLKEGYQRGDARGMIKPADGWEWVAPDDPKSIQVRRKVAYHFPAIATNIIGVRLYEGPYDGVPLGKREYRLAFPASTTRYVNIELNVERAKSGAPATAEVTCTYYRPDNTSMGVMKINLQMDAAWTKAYSWNGLGWKETGYWKPGNYRISCTHNGNEVAKADFVMQ